MSLHAITHLPYQVRVFGALWSTSATLFENCYRHLKRCVHGTRDEGRQMVKGFLSRKFASHTLERKEDTQLSFIATPIGDYAITLSDTYNFSIPYNAMHFRLSS